MPHKEKKRKRHRKRSRSWESTSQHSAHSSKSSAPESDQDEEGTVKFRPGDYIRDKRYKIITVAGKGTFGTVLEVFDYKHEEKIALKVVRSVKRYLEAAYVEVDILDKIRKADRRQSSLCVRLLGAFTTHIRHQKHVCIAFERLGKSVYEFIKANRYRGFTLPQVADMGFQLCHAIEFCHSIDLTHTDLKPENILLVNDEYTVEDINNWRDYRSLKNSEIRIIDFGGATFADDHHSQMINTRQYRAPEVILGNGWDEKSDVWSIGCILAELFTGELLFGTHEDIEHLALMQKIMKRNIPKHMIRKALKRFEKTSSKKRSKKQKRKQKGRSPSTVPLNKIFSFEKSELCWPDQASTKESVNYVKDARILPVLIPDPGLRNAIDTCLTYDPKERLTAEELKKLPFFSNSDFGQRCRGNS